MHILITAWGYPGNTEKGNPYVKELAEALQRRGHQVTVMLYTYINAVAYAKRLLLRRPLTDWQRSSGVDILDVVIINFMPGALLRSGRRHRLLAGRRVGNVLQRFIGRKGRPDLIQHHFILNGQPHITHDISRRFGLPYVIFEHSHNIDDASVERKVGRWMSRQELFDFVGRASARIARTEVFKRRYETYFGHGFMAIPNFVSDTYDKLPIRGGRSTEFTFLSIGTLQQRKRFDRLIEAFHAGFSDKPAKLVIAGDGDLKDELHQLVVRLGIAHKVDFAGWVDRKGVFSAIDAAHVVVVASDRETFANTLVEALSRGVPVISTKCGGPEEIITAECGLLAERTVEDLAAKMLEIHDRYVEYDPEHMKAICRERFSERHVLDRIEALYSKVVEDARSSREIHR